MPSTAPRRIRILVTVESGAVPLVVGQHVVGLRVVPIRFDDERLLDRVRCEAVAADDPAAACAETVTGRVVALAALYRDLVRRPDGRLRPGAGSARLEPLGRTADTRGPRPQRVEWQHVVEVEPGVIAQGGFGVPSEGDEVLEGWIATVAPSSPEPGRASPIGG